MEADTGTQEPTTGQAEPSAEPVEPAAAASPEDSGREGADRLDTAKAMNAFMRGELADPGATSKPDDAAPTGQSAPSEGDEAPGGPERGADGRFIPRRGIPKAVEERDARIADLERQLASRDPERIVRDYQERQAASALAESEQAEAARYEHLNSLPDDHPELNEGDNYSWLQEYKRVLSLVPKAEQQHRALSERQVAREREALTQSHAAFEDGYRQQMLTGAREFGVDPESWKKPGTTWLDMTRSAVAAQTAPLQARIRELESDLEQHARLNGASGLGSVRVPALAGRSGNGARERTMNDWLRGG